MARVGLKGQGQVKKNICLLCIQQAIVHHCINALQSFVLDHNNHRLQTHAILYYPSTLCLFTFGGFVFSLPTITRPCRGCEGCFALKFHTVPTFENGGAESLHHSSNGGRCLRLSAMSSSQILSGIRLLCQTCQVGTEEPAHRPVCPP